MQEHSQFIIQEKDNCIGSPGAELSVSQKITMDEQELTSQAAASLQEKWKHMYQRELPEAASARSSPQPVWPVHVDHCFARIILDKVIGGGAEPWIEKIKAPAYKHMSCEQLKEAIKLGEQILGGDVDLVALNNSSLVSRCKTGKGKGQERGKLLVEMDEVSPFFNTPTKANKRKRDKVGVDAGDDQDLHPPTKRNPESKRSTLQYKSQATVAEKATVSTTDRSALLRKIEKSTKTMFQKRVLSLLCQVPLGSYTTYGAMARHLNSSARAVGNGLKNNPFAPEVPCHRVLATGGALGGFGGSWGRNGEEGKNDKEKRRLLQKEGIKFDGKGRVVGSVWDRFQ